MPDSKPPALVDQYGRPLKTALLSREVAAPTRASVRTIQSGHPAQGIDPAKLGRLLREAEDGNAIAYFELAEEMEEKDLHYLSVLRTRKLAVSQLPIEVERADETEEAEGDAKLVEDWLDRDMLETEIFNLLDAIGKGVSSVEMVWNTKQVPWVPELKWRDPRWFEFDRVNGTDLLLRGGETGMGEPTPLPGGKFIVHIHPSKSGLPIRSGLARIAAWGYMFKNFAIKDWVTFLEAFGHPLRIGKYGPNESEENKAILHRALYELGSDAAAAFPETMNVEFIDRKGGTAPNDLWRSHAEYFDLQLSKAVLGQTSTTDAVAGGLGDGQANAHSDVAETIERADAKLLAATLNRELVPILVMLNRGPRAKYPRLRIGRPDARDVKTEIESARELTKLGVSIDGNEMRDRAGLPAGKGDGTDLRPQSPQNGEEGQNGGDVAGTTGKRFLDLLKSTTADNEQPALQSQERSGEPDTIDRTADEMLDDWEMQVDEMLDPVEALAGDCADLSELQARLSEAIGKMEPRRFGELMAAGGFAARITGEADASADGD
ncbi:MAG: DUF935 domain-containing protein [Sphingomonadales bacterium CG12_big_fil_rev_8_21_14_0_65_65_10]|nr:MAG: DUF935 domain-containing protein [Sphingomonadales bacterium CG12_big_fil_rev_8_21_14_0_65_65_10]